MKDALLCRGFPCQGYLRPFRAGCLRFPWKPGWPRVSLEISCCLQDDPPFLVHFALPKHTKFGFIQLKFFSRDAATVVGYSRPELGRRAGVYSRKIGSLRAFLLISSSASEGIYVTPCFVCRHRNGVSSVHVKLRLIEKWNLDYF